MLFSIMTIISAIWFITSAGLKGWFGIRFKRRVQWLTFDKKESERLSRILARYQNGEFTVQFSNYGDNLLFTKWVDGSLAGTSYAENVIYVNVGDVNSISFGVITTDPMYPKNIEKDPLVQKYKLTNKVYFELLEIVTELKETPNHHKMGGLWGKRKKEEVNLS